MQKLWALCDLTSGLLLTKTSNYDLKEFPADTRIPTMYFYPTPDFVNTRVFLPPELQYQPNKKSGLTLAMVNAEHRPVKKVKGKAKPEGVGPLGTDVKVGRFFHINYQWCWGRSSLIEEVEGGRFL